MKEPVVISYEMALKGLKAAVEAKGEDFIYTPFVVHTEDGNGTVKSCRYFDPQGQPSCIVGHVLDMYGIEPFPFDSGVNITGVSGLAFQSVQKVICADEQAKYLLSIAQGNQDTGHTWGESVAFAEAQVSNPDV